MILSFGQHKGKALSNPEIPDDYILWLAKPVYSGKFYKSLHSTELTWKVPFNVKIAAREEAERRGWKLRGSEWERD